MKINTEYDALVLTIGELSTLARQPGSAENALSLVPKIAVENQGAIIAEFARLDKDMQADYAKALAMLAAPSQIARLNYAVADEMLTRMYLAWRPEDKMSVAVLSTTGEQVQISLQPAANVEATLSRALALDNGLLSIKLTQVLSSTAVIILVAVMDYFRYSRQLSLLAHAPPQENFTRQDVMERLKQSSAEDFRWPLLLLDKVFPVPIARLFQIADVTAALEELCLKGLLLRNEAATGQPDLTLYSLTKAADIICESMAHDVSRAALSTSSVTADGYIGHESLLLERGSDYLWLFGIGGREGLVASLDADQFSGILQKALAPPEALPPVINNRPRPTQAVSASPGDSASTGKVMCPRCGTLNTGGDKFCIKCGSALTVTGTNQFCIKCGSLLKSGNKFCEKCGTPT